MLLCINHTLSVWLWGFYGECMWRNVDFVQYWWRSWCGAVHMEGGAAVCLRRSWKVFYNFEVLSFWTKIVHDRGGDWFIHKFLLVRFYSCICGHMVYRLHILCELQVKFCINHSLFCCCCFFEWELGKKEIWSVEGTRERSHQWEVGQLNSTWVP